MIWGEIRDLKCKKHDLKWKMMIRGEKHDLRWKTWFEVKIEIWSAKNMIRGDNHDLRWISWFGVKIMICG